MKTNYLSKTGDKCPVKGKWVSLEDYTSMVFIRKGDLMPSYKGRSVNWQLKKSLS